MFYLLALITRAFLASRKLAYSLVDRSVLEWGGMMELCRMEILCLADYVISIPEHWSTTLQLFLPLTLAPSILPHEKGDMKSRGPFCFSPSPFRTFIVTGPLSFLLFSRNTLTPHGSIRTVTWQKLLSPPDSLISSWLIDCWNWIGGPSSDGNWTSL